MSFQDNNQETNRLSILDQLDLPDDFDYDSVQFKTEGKGIGGHLQDIGVSALKGAVQVPNAVVGLADIATGGQAGKALENLGFRPKETLETLDSWKTDQAKVQQKVFSESDGVWDKTKVALQNPSLVSNTVIESLPLMFGGGVIGRGVNAVAKTSPLVGGAIGEGAVMAGSQASDIRHQTEDGLLNAEQQGLSVATGVLGGLFGYAGGRLAQKMGFGDIDSMLVSGRVSANDVAREISQTPLKSVPKQILFGALSEGLLEELPQSVSEQILQNMALGRDIGHGVEDAIVMGTLAGMAMGSGASALKAFSTKENVDNTTAVMPNVQQNVETPQQTSFTQPWNEQELQGLKYQQFVTDALNKGVFDQLPSVLGEQVKQNLQKGEFWNDNLNGNEVLSMLSNVMGVSLAEPSHHDIGANIDYSKVSPFEVNPVKTEIDYSKFDTQQVEPTTPIKPSEQLGLDPNAGTLSAAATVAVDSGASTINVPQVDNSTVNTPSWTENDIKAFEQRYTQALWSGDETIQRQLFDEQRAKGRSITDIYEQIQTIMYGDKPLQNHQIDNDDNLDALFEEQDNTLPSQELDLGDGKIQSYTAQEIEFAERLEQLERANAPTEQRQEVLNWAMDNDISQERLVSIFNAVHDKLQAESKSTSQNAVEPTVETRSQRMTQLANRPLSDKAKQQLQQKFERLQNNDTPLNPLQQKMKQEMQQQALAHIATPVLAGRQHEVQDVIEQFELTQADIDKIQANPQDNYLDRAYQDLPNADKVVNAQGQTVGSTEQKAIYLPKTKGKQGGWAIIKDDYVLSMDNAQYVDLPPMSREQALELAKAEFGQNKFYDVVPRAYVQHLGYKAVADNRNLHRFMPKAQTTVNTKAESIENEATKNSDIQTEVPQNAVLNSQYNPKTDTLSYAKDVAEQMLQYYQGDKQGIGLQDSQNALSTHSAVADLLYYRNSPTIKDVQVFEQDGQAVVRVTSAKSGRVEQRTYPKALVGVNQFLDNMEKPLTLDNHHNSSSNSQALQQEYDDIDIPQLLKTKAFHELTQREQDAFERYALSSEFGLELGLSLQENYNLHIKFN